MAKASKAPKRLEDELFQIGFGRDSLNYYQAQIARVPAYAALYFGRKSGGYQVSLGVYYYAGESGFLMSPFEYHRLMADGSLRSTFGKGTVSLWKFGSRDDGNHAFLGHLRNWISAFSASTNMIEVYRYLLGEIDHPPEPFELVGDFVSRKETPLRLMGMIGYQVVAGNFSCANSYFHKLSGSPQDEFKTKLEQDIREQVCRETAHKKFLKGIGASSLVM